MTRKAQFFIGVTIAAGGGLVASCIATGAFGLSDAYIAYCLIAWFASTLKVRLPGMTGTMAANFPFVLVSVAVFSLSETVLLATVACAIQCFAKARRRPRLVQVAFNVAAWAISSGASYRISHWLARDKDGMLIVLLPVAACLFFVMNTFLVSGVLSLVEKKPLFKAWQHCYLWVFPFYLVGSAIAGLVVETGRTQGWRMSLFILPLLYMVYLFYRTCVTRFSAETAATPPA